MSGLKPKLAAVNGVRVVPGSDLTVKQRRIAVRLRAIRPATLPGTDVIADGKQARVWHEEVTNAAVALELKEAQLKTFFDTCGVTKDG